MSARLILDEFGRSMDLPCPAKCDRQATMITRTSIGRRYTYPPFYREENGTEHEYVLTVWVSPPCPGTYWEPAYPGDVERESLMRDGVSVSVSAFDDVVTEILQGPVPAEDGYR